MASSYPARVLQYDGSSGDFIRVFADASSAVVGQQLGGVVFGPDGNLYACTGWDDSVLCFDGATGSLLGEIVTPGQNGIYLAWAMAFGPDGDLYVGSGKTNEILRYQLADTAGQPATFVEVFASGNGMDAPWYVTFGPDDNLYVASAGSNEVLKFHGPLAYFPDEPGDYLNTFIQAGSGGLNQPVGLTFDDDALYVVSRGSNQVLRYDAVTGAFIDVFVDTGLDLPLVAAIGRDGNLLVSNRDGHNLQRFGLDYQAVFTVSLSAPMGQSVSVDYLSANGSATVTKDYEQANGTLTFAPGETSKSIIVPTLDDSDVEGNETFTVTLSNPTGNVTIPSGQETGMATIIDTDFK